MPTAGGTNMSGEAPTPTAYVVPGADSAGRYGSTTRLAAANPDYADPSLYAENYYIDTPASEGAPPFRLSPTGVPDSSRLGMIPIYDYRPQPFQNPPSAWWLNPGNGPGYDEQRRHNSQEFVDADGMTLFRGSEYPNKRAAPDPRRTPPVEPRLTQQMSPHRYVFTRPFDQHAARQFNGDHFSMADHRRTYPVMGMAPVGWKRNTYRADPTPWDTNIVDYPPNAADEYRGAGGFITGDVPFRASRSGRLD